MGTQRIEKPSSAARISSISLASDSRSCGARSTAMKERTVPVTDAPPGSGIVRRALDTAQGFRPGDGVQREA